MRGYCVLCIALLSACACACGCSKEQAPARRTAPWLASASASAASSPARLSLHFLPESSVRFSLPSTKADPTGQLPVVEGKLELDPADLPSTRGYLEADLLRLALDPASLPPETGLDAQSAGELALQWLELGSSVPPERRQQLSRARFELTAIEGLSATSLELDARRSSRVRATAIGSLLLHGFRAPVRVEVSVQALPRSPDGPLRVSIRSIKALVLPLDPHDVAPRDASGFGQASQTRFAGKPGRSAKITFELVAEASARASK